MDTCSDINTDKTLIVDCSFSFSLGVGLALEYSAITVSILNVTTYFISKYYHSYVCGKMSPIMVY